MNAAACNAKTDSYHHGKETLYNFADVSLFVISQVIAMVDPSQGRCLGRGATDVVGPSWLTLPRGGTWEEVLLQQTIPSNHKAVLPKGSTTHLLQQSPFLKGFQQLRLHSLSSLIIHQGRLPIPLWELTPYN